jgi:hypothetical protein
MLKVQSWCKAPEIKEALAGIAKRTKTGASK